MHKEAQSQPPIFNGLEMGASEKSRYQKSKSQVTKNAAEIKMRLSDVLLLCYFKNKERATATRGKVKQFPLPSPLLKAITT
jgi:hypothetical protein